jgi:N-acetylmuramoyl-L-alanine amidase
MKLCIDPGHGMSSKRLGAYDSGACAVNQEEAEWALLYAQTLRASCDQRGIASLMTRETPSESAPLGSRVKRALDAGCTHFISLHLNHSDSPAANGIETIYRDGCRDFASAVQSAVQPILGLRDRGLKHDQNDLGRKLAVLRFPGPCALIELGFISSVKDMRIITDASYRIQSMAALADYLKTL